MGKRIFAARQLGADGRCLSFSSQDPRQSVVCKVSQNRCDRNDRTLMKGLFVIRGHLCSRCKSIVTMRDLTVE